MSQTGMLLIVDYNLSRAADVARMARHAKIVHGVRTVLIRANPGPSDSAICDEVVDLDPALPDFVDQAMARLTPWRDALRAGVVFSDNAVHSGALLLERLGLSVDCASLAVGAFSKYAYRQAEAAHGPLLRSQHVLLLDCARISSLAELEAFADLHRDGFVVKPACEGNNRGVVVVHAGDDLQAAFDEVSPYLANGVICEQLIRYRREYSYDGIGALSFITEKVSASGRYPVEVAQVLPSRLKPMEWHTLHRAGQLCNVLVGQRDGPFHNEVKLSDDGMRAAVVEPNRRPGGMKIWSLAEAVYGIDLYALWVDSVLGEPAPISLPQPLRQAATVMLGVAQDTLFSPLDLDGGRLFEQALAMTCRLHSLPPGQLLTGEFGWIAQGKRVIHAVPRDNADFAAQATIVLGADGVDIRPIITTLRQAWITVLPDPPRAEAINAAQNCATGPISLALY
jgi:hypothetical protein